jgi:serine-type D-Ala-D-Ala carboxypeptidase (penicillin-binding protein 5/6)
VSDLIVAIAVQSANDASIALAEGLEGSEEEFARKMELRAKDLRFKTATFRNATGLPDDGQKMSVSDLAAMARYIIATFPDQYPVFAQPDFTWNKITQPNRNPLLKDYPGADGLKTGYTKEAGYGLVGSAMRGNRRLIMVITGLENVADRKREAQRLLDWGFSRFKPLALYAAGEEVGSARVWGGVERRVGLVTRTPIEVALSADEQETAEIKLAYMGPLRAPVKAGEKVGVVRFIVDGNSIAEAPVETAADVAENPSMWTRALDSVMIMVFGG